jgi:hypothetical protein
LESLPDGQILALCELQMLPEPQAQLSDLLARNQEGQLSSAEVQQLDDINAGLSAGIGAEGKGAEGRSGTGLKTRIG